MTVETQTRESKTGEERAPTFPSGDEVIARVGATSRAQSLRDQMPMQGLREYWYPALLAKDVGRRKPASRRMLGEIVVFFRGTNGKIAAVSDACPHRGAALSRGETHFDGTISCPYHGWTFDETGELLAALGDGPDARVAGLKSSRVRVYPTRVLKGVVFVWMGTSEPAPAEEDIPPEFFADDSLVMWSVTEWPTNWRPSMENYMDSHVFYVHRNSLRILGLPARFLSSALKLGTGKINTKVINGRALALDATDAFMGIGTTTNVARAKVQAPPQHVFPTLGGARWPATRSRLWLSVLMEYLIPPKAKAPLETNEEWKAGMHLPGWISTDNSAFMYRRMVVPIDADRSRIIYFHTRRPKSVLQRWWGLAIFHLWRNWTYNYNFSGQDGHAVEGLHYDTPENLSGTDAYPMAWRRMVVTWGRDFLRSRS